MDFPRDGHLENKVPMFVDGKYHGRCPDETLSEMLQTRSAPHDLEHNLSVKFELMNGKWLQWAPYNNATKSAPEPKDIKTILVTRSPKEHMAPWIIGLRHVKTL